MLSQEDNELLVRVGPGTPMGQFLRRFWVPILLADELSEPGGTPVKVQVLGERFVAFRDSTGRLGVLDAYCTHRRAHLYWGRNEDGGLRCAYHGWKFDVLGNCIDVPNAPEGERIRSNMRTRSYPVREMGNLVWAYLGPPELMPNPPLTEAFNCPAEHVHATRLVLDGNWMQMMEGDVDSSHVSFLHSDPALMENLRKAGRSSGDYLVTDRNPRWFIERTDYGLMLAARRNADADSYFWRVNQWLMPFATMIAGRDDTPNIVILRIPIDDEHTMEVRTYAHPTRPLNEKERAYTQDGVFFPGIIPGTRTPVENLGNEYLVDRARQKAGAFTGIRSFAAQDLAMTQDQGGPILDRTREKLTSADAAIVNVRRALIDAARALTQNEEPPEARNPHAYRVRPLEIVLPRSTSITAGGGEQMRGVAVVAGN